MSNELVPYGENSPYAVLRMEGDGMSELVESALGGEALRFGDFDKIKVPGGGGQMWEVDTLAGTEGMKVIEAVVIGHSPSRAYWSTGYDERTDDDDGSPDCYSDDNKVGVGEPGGDCALCPLNEFGSGANGVGKACKEMRQLFLLLPDSILPYVLTLPPASLGNWRSHTVRLLRAQLSPQQVVTKIGLQKAESTVGKIKYSKVTFEVGNRLDPEAVARVKEYAAAFADSMKARRPDRDDAQ